jgi:uncharacterized protein (TIGR02646 family)
MRAIDIIRVRTAITEAWLQNASAKTVTLQELHDQITAEHAANQKTWRERMTDAVNRMESVWQDKGLKQALMDSSFGKCWYCEARVAQRADNAIDHFRPKNRVAEDKTHPGYWWLACDWRNYRFACTFCNSARTTRDSAGGKQDHFPLWDELRRVRVPTEPLIGEQPKLLDPANPADISYLAFDRNGKPVPRYSKEQNLYQYERATESIRRYHLDRSELNRNRMELMASIDEKLSSAEQFARDLGGQNPTAEAAYKQAFVALIEFIRPQAEFSLAARVFLASKRGTSIVACELLDISL